MGYNVCKKFGHVCVCVRVRVGARVCVQVQVRVRARVRVCALVRGFKEWIRPVYKFSNYAAHV